jgi:hypothetical protein
MLPPISFRNILKSISNEGPTGGIGFVTVVRKSVEVPINACVQDIVMYKSFPIVVVGEFRYLKICLRISVPCSR